MKTKSFIEAIRSETLGFSFGKPWRYGEKSITCVMPIIRISDTKRNYLTLEEAKNVEIKDTGSISETMITNNEKKPVFIRMGTLLKGATQERSTTLGRVVLPKETVKINVVCVHATKGINPNTLFNYGGYTPQRDGQYLTAMHRGGVVAQSESWSSDSEYIMGYASSNSRSDRASISSLSIKADDLTSVVEETREIFQDVIKKMPLHDNQIGISLIDTKGMHSLECYDLHDSWKAVKEEIAGKEALSLGEEDKSGVFEYKPKNAKGIIKKALEQGYSGKVQIESERTKTMTLDYGKYIGEIVSLDDMPIHLLLARKENG